MLNTDEALERLRQGNENFRTGPSVRHRWTSARGDELIEGQRPFAVILSCSDSRVSPEIIFDTGLGELFVVRVAGNVATPSTIASAEYAVAELGTRLIVVMAHQNCGAVAATIAGGDAGKNLNRLVSYIKPAVESTENSVDVVAKRNARMQAERLTSESEIIREATEKGGVRIVTAFFHLADGKVEFD